MVGAKVGDIGLFDGALVGESETVERNDGIIDGLIEGTVDGCREGVWDGFIELGILDGVYEGLDGTCEYDGSFV